MRKFRLIGRKFPDWLKGRIVDVEVNTTDGYFQEYYIPQHKITLGICHEWEVEEVPIFNEYLKLIKQ